MASQTRLALLRQHSGLSDEEELHGTYYCTHTQPRFGATFLQGWLYVFDSALIFDANLLAVNRVQCIIPLQNVRVIRKRTLLRINNTIAVEWEDSDGTPHYDIFTSFMFGSRSRAFDTMVEHWRRACPAVSSSLKTVNSRDWRNSLANLPDNTQLSEQDSGSHTTILAADQSPFFVSALRSSLKQSLRQPDAVPSPPDFPIWPPLVLAEEQPTKVETDSGISMHLSREDVKQLEPLQLQDISVQKFAQVLLSDRSGFLPAAHCAQGDVLQDNPQGLTCWQVIPRGQPHAGGLVRYMRHFHTTADNYRAHVTQQQVLMMTPTGTLVLQILQSLQVLNKLTIDVGKHCCALIRWEITPSGNSTADHVQQGSSSTDVMTAALSSSSFLQRPEYQHKQQTAQTTRNDSAPPLASRSASKDTRSSQGLGRIRRRNSAPVFDVVNNNTSGAERSPSSGGPAAADMVHDVGSRRQNSKAIAVAVASPSSPATPNRSRSGGSPWPTDHWHASSFNDIQSHQEGPDSDDNSSSSDARSGIRSSDTGASNASKKSSVGTADGHKSAAAAALGKEAASPVPTAAAATGGDAAAAGAGCVWRVEVQLAGTNSALFSLVKHRSLNASVKYCQSIMNIGRDWLLNEGLRQTVGDFLPHAEAAVAEAQAAVAAGLAEMNDTDQRGGRHSRNSSWASAVSPTPASYADFLQEQRLLETLNSNLSINLQLQQGKIAKPAGGWWVGRRVVSCIKRTTRCIFNLLVLGRWGVHGTPRSGLSPTAALASGTPVVVPVQSPIWSAYAVRGLLGLQLLSTALILLALWRVVVLQERIVQMMSQQSP